MTFPISKWMILADGEFIRGSDGTPQRQGFGLHVTSDGNVYRGSWHEDKMNGDGCMQFESGAKYEGLSTFPLY